MAQGGGYRDAKNGSQLFESFEEQFSVQIAELPEDLLQLTHLRVLEVQSSKVCVKVTTLKMVYYVVCVCVCGLHTNFTCLPHLF
jgi:hypothetical protein